jgi:hypothetical protein
VANKYNRRSRPNFRHRVEFWKPTSVTDSAGELKSEYVLVYAGTFAMELPKTPTEVSDLGRVQPQQEFMLLGQYTPKIKELTAGLFAVVKDLQKVVVLAGNATDPWGDRRKMHVRVTDNLAQEITTKIMSTIY